MRLWIDILTPKQVNFFAPLIRRLSQRGKKPLVTTRQYREVNELMEIRKISALKVGEHGGGILKTKLISSAERIKRLAVLLSSQKCDIALSFSSPEAARVAYGLSIPHYCISDSPHAEAASRLTIPLSKMLFTPKAVPMDAWRNYGIDEDRIVRYNALDPIVWLRDFRPNPKILDELGLDDSLPIITIRPEETQASYLLRYSSDKPLSALVARALRQELPHSQVVLIPRYDLAPSTKKLVGRSIVVADRAIDATSLLHYSHVFLGGGGTMTTEAALLGIPSVSFYPAPPTYVERYLTRLRLVTRIGDLERIVNYVIRILGDEVQKEALKAASRRIRSKMEDPMAVIEKHLR